MAEMGKQFYKESGELFKLAGVLRAADILWNPEKRQVFLSFTVVLFWSEKDIYSHPLQKIILTSFTFSPVFPFSFSIAISLHVTRVGGHFLRKITA
jgi:hypothetical protein